VVQPDQGLWIHPAQQRWQGRFRSHFGSWRLVFRRLEGQTVEYEEIANRGKTSAENLKV
jgi:hypothetical protein